ncbi:MAG: hypothetical protein KDJ88_21280, partial [Bauldia sp.]|nr:hypothetical protein [Bauldia sp.]
MNADEAGKEDGKGAAAAGGPSGAEPKVKPAVTIDLKAEPVKAGSSEKKPGTPGKESPPDRESPAARGATEEREPPPPPPPPKPAPPGEGGPRRVGVVGLVVAAVIGGIVATALGIIYHASGVVPTRSEVIAQEALDKINAIGVAVDGLDKRVAAVESQPAAPASSDIAGLTEKLTALEALEKENRDRIAKLEAAPAAPATPPVDGAGAGAAVAAELSDLKARIDKLEADASAAASAASSVSSLTDRVAALEALTKDLGDKVAALAARPAESEKAARAAAIAILQQAVEAGGPFAPDLAMLKALGLDQADVAKLESLAVKDTPNVATLQKQFPEVADAILAATMTEDPDKGFLDSVGSFFGSLVTVRPTGAIPGDSPEAVVSRMQAAVDSGDIATALAERAKLPEVGQQASADWAQAAEDRLTINQ